MYSKFDLNFPLTVGSCWYKQRGQSNYTQEYKNEWDFNAFKTKPIKIMHRDTQRMELKSFLSEEQYK